MNLSELQSVQSKERQADSLQNLRASFYEEAGEFIQELREERARAADEADDPFASDEVGQLTDKVETAEATVEAIYERRVGKVVKMASIAAADMPTEEEGLTAEERRLFDALVETIEANRERVMAVVDGDDPGSASGDAPDPSEAVEDVAPDVAEDAETGVDAADLMGGASDEGDRADGDAEPTGSEDRDGPPAKPQSPDERSVDADEGATHDGGGDVERATIHVKSDVGEILGVDERAYDLSADDVVTLPEQNADPLVQRGAAERLD